MKFYYRSDGSRQISDSQIQNKTNKTSMHVIYNTEHCLKSYGPFLDFASKVVDIGLTPRRSELSNRNPELWPLP